MIETLKIIALIILFGVYIYAIFGLYIARSMYNDFELSWIWKIPLMPLYVVIMYILQGIDEGLSFLKHHT